MDCSARWLQAAGSYPVPPPAETFALPRSSVNITERLAIVGPRRGFGWTAALVLLIGGCHGAAYRDVYQQKMASEIRVLEDQLYQADYDNQVLRDELTRLEIKASQVHVPIASPRRSLFGGTLDAADEVSELPKPDPAPAPRLPARPLPNTSERPSARPPDNRYTPPAEPVPPGASDLMVPDVELGDPVPPPALEGASESPPGKIELPDSAKILTNEPPREPVAIRINSALSGGYKTDEEPLVEGMTLIVEAIDDRGTVVPLDQFDIDADLSVVLLDPARPAASARLGKWQFGPEEIREMIRGDFSPTLAGSGVHVMIPWQELRPETATVIAHVRLTAGEVVMQTQAEITTSQPSMVKWTPRSAMTR